MAFFEQKISEPKPSKDGLNTVRTVKVGNKLIGTIESPKLKPGEKPAATYWTNSKVIRISDGGRYLTVSQRHIAGLSMYAVKRIGLRCTDGTTYQISYETATKSEVKVPFLDIPTVCWDIEYPPEIVRVAMVTGAMRVAGGRGRRS